MTEQEKAVIDAAVANIIACDKYHRAKQEYDSRGSFTTVAKHLQLSIEYMKAGVRIEESHLDVINAINAMNPLLLADFEKGAFSYHKEPLEGDLVGK